eukprot:5577037-Karenia_brevis.AAC.1
MMMMMMMMMMMLMMMMMKRGQVQSKTREEGLKETARNSAGKVMAFKSADAADYELKSLPDLCS